MGSKGAPPTPEHGLGPVIVSRGARHHLAVTGDWIDFLKCGAYCWNGGVGRSAAKNLKLLCRSQRAETM